MKRRIALNLLALLGVAGLSACRAAPVMTDIKQSVPPGLLLEDFWQSSQSILLLDTTFGFWREQKNWGSLEQVGMFKAPADYGMQQAVDFYQQKFARNELSLLEVRHLYDIL